jgi:hypothetical protein
MKIVDARFVRAVDKRNGEADRLVVYVNRELKSGKYDEVVIDSEQARHLAMRLLIAAERAEGKEVRVW